MSRMEEETRLSCREMKLTKNRKTGKGGGREATDLNTFSPNRAENDSICLLLAHCRGCSFSKAEHACNHPLLCNVFPRYEVVLLSFAAVERLFVEMEAFSS